MALNYTNGTNIYRKSLLDALPVRTAGFFFQTDIVIRSVKQGYLFAEVPYCLSLRTHGKSKALSLRSLAKVAQAYLRLVFDVYFDRRRKLPPLVDDSRSAMRVMRECEPAAGAESHTPQTETSKETQGNR